MFLNMSARRHSRVRTEASGPAGAPAHAVPVATRAPRALDGRRAACHFGEALIFPVKVRDLTRDAAVALAVLDDRFLFRGGVRAGLQDA